MILWGRMKVEMALHSIYGIFKFEIFEPAKNHPH